MFIEFYSISYYFNLNLTHNIILEIFMKINNIKNSIYGKNFRLYDLILKFVLFLSFFIISFIFIFFLFYIFFNFIY